ncbi:hypothetical protein ACFQ1S_34735, partial [Kibdelosporangium lantanae]
LDLPTRQTEYVSADPSITWYGGLAKYVGPGISGWHGGHYETPHTYLPGQVVKEDWNRFPLHPAGEVNQLDANTYTWGIQPPALRFGDTVRFHLTPFSDNTPGHTGFGYSGESRDTVTGQYQVIQNGVPLAGTRTASTAPWWTSTCRWVTRRCSHGGPPRTTKIRLGWHMPCTATRPPP